MGPIFCSGSISLEVIPPNGACDSSQATSASNKMYPVLFLFYALENTNRLKYQPDIA